jgi:hypothetical protein
MIRAPVSAAAAPDMLRIPVDHFIEQAHQPLVRNVAFDPAAV